MTPGLYELKKSTFLCNQVLIFCRSGKSSIQKVVFHKVSPNETLFLESTCKIVKEGKILCKLHFRKKWMHTNEPRYEKPKFWFPTWSDTNQAVQLQKMTRGLKLWILKIEGLYYLFSKNKGADQLRGYREADLRLCFRICKTLVFS